MCHVNTGSLPPVCQVRMSGPPTVKLWVVTGREGELLCCVHTATPHLLVFLRMNWNKKLLAAAITPESAARHEAALFTYEILCNISPGAARLFFEKVDCGEDSCENGCLLAL